MENEITKAFSDFTCTAMEGIEKLQAGIVAIRVENQRLTQEANAKDQRIVVLERALELLLDDVNNPQREHTNFYYGIVNTVDSILGQTEHILKEPRA